MTMQTAGQPNASCGPAQGERSASKHTPGPWSAAFDGHGGMSIDSSSCQIGYVSRGAGRQEANASLIAAAPDLIEALERARSLLATAEGQFPPEFNARVREAITQARKAIARATS